MSEKKMYRQGDVLLIACESVPEGLTRVDDPVLVRGEATGHAHRLTGGEHLVLAGELARQFLKASPEGATITHEEHAPIYLPPNGYWEVRRQVEYTPVRVTPVRD